MSEPQWSDIPCDAPARERERQTRQAAEALTAALRRTSWDWCLLHNLAMVGALCASFELGGFAKHVIAAAQGRTAWRPGCGHEAST